MFKWLEDRRDQKRKRERIESRRSDHMRPYRVAQRLNLRIQQAAEDKDLDRCKVLMRRMRRVRDYQIRVFGH